jgi:two-component system response regulator
MAEILVVDDEPVDVKLMINALNSSKLGNNITVARDGMEAMQILKQVGEYSNMPRPDLIILDLNMPKKSGIEVLQEIRKDENLKMIPIVVVTTSDSDEDIIKSYSEGANCYIQKPLDLDKFKEIVKGIENFWFYLVTLPKKS